MLRGVTQRIALIPGDGAGPEVIAEARKAVDTLGLDVECGCSAADPRWWQQCGVGFRLASPRAQTLTSRVRIPVESIQTRESLLTIFARTLSQCGQRRTMPAPR